MRRLERRLRLLAAFNALALCALVPLALGAFRPSHGRFADLDVERLRIVTPDGTALRNPTEAEIAAAVGLTTDPVSDFYDLIVIGGGPAGLGSAVYGASEGLRTVLVERQATGGQAGQSSRIDL